MKRRKIRNPRLEKLFEASQTKTALANALGITLQSVADWRDIPPEHCLRIEKTFGVSRYELRPDIFGPRPEHCSE